MLVPGGLVAPPTSVCPGDVQDHAADAGTLMEGPCEIARIRKDVTAKTFDFLQSEIADDVSLSKLGLAAAWKSESQEIERKVANGTITQRPYGDVINIGHRTTRDPFKGQGDDQAWGKTRKRLGGRRLTGPSPRRRSAIRFCVAPRVPLSLRGELAIPSATIARMRAAACRVHSGSRTTCRYVPNSAGRLSGTVILVRSRLPRWGAV